VAQGAGAGAGADADADAGAGEDEDEDDEDGAVAVAPSCASFGGVLHASSGARARVRVSERSMAARREATIAARSSGAWANGPMDRARYGAGFAAQPLLSSHVKSLLQVASAAQTLSAWVPHV
jgi:hypothetical protein